MLVIDKLTGVKGGLTIDNLELYTRDRTQIGISGTGSEIPINKPMFYNFFNLKSNDTTIIKNFLLMITNYGPNKIAMGCEGSGLYSANSATIDIYDQLNVDNYNYPSVAYKRFFSPIYIPFSEKTLLNKTGAHYQELSKIKKINFPTTTSFADYEDDYLYWKVGIENLGYYNKITYNSGNTSFTPTNNTFYVINYKITHKSLGTYQEFRIAFYYQDDCFIDSNACLRVGFITNTQSITGGVISIRKGNIFITESSLTDCTITVDVYKIPLCIKTITNKAS